MVVVAQVNNTKLWLLEVNVLEHMMVAIISRIDSILVVAIDRQHRCLVCFSCSRVPVGWC